MDTEPILGTADEESSQRWVSLGAKVMSRSPEGVELGVIFPGNAAHKAGLQKGDIILDIKVRNTEDLSNLLNGKVAGCEFVLHVLRDRHQELWVKVRPEEWSGEDEAEAWQRYHALEQDEHPPWWQKLIKGR